MRLASPTVATLMIMAAFSAGAAENIIGEIVVPGSDLPVRETPPGVFFQPKGTQLGVTMAGEKYRVLEETAVPTLFGTETWLKVTPLDPSMPGGWVFSGRGGSPFGNVTMGQ